MAEVSVAVGDKSIQNKEQSMSEEVWKPVVGYEGVYEVSSEGRVRSLDRWVERPRGAYTKRGRVLRAGLGGVGYLTVSLHTGGKSLSCAVHRLVARAFLPNPDSLKEVNHRDLNKTNNHVDNLEWVSPRNNTAHAWEKGAMRPRVKMTEAKLAELARLRAAGLNHKSISERLGVSRSLVSLYASGRRTLSSFAPRT